MIPPREVGPMNARQRAIAQRLVGQEVLLLDYIRKLERHRADRNAVIIRLSRLQPANRRDHHLRIAASSFDVMIKMLKGQLFALHNSDLVFVFKASAVEEMEAQAVKLRFMFSDDPLLAQEGVGGKPAFVDWYHLERDYDVLLQFAQHAALEEQQRRRQNDAQAKATPKFFNAPMREDPFAPELLAKVEDHLSGAGLSNMLRRQAVCAIVGKSAPQPVFHELFISIADLRQTLMPSVNLASSPWLFQQLTETLDRRVLSLLNKHDDSTIAGDVSINLNVQTMLSADFFKFDDNIKASMRGTIVLEIQKVDIFADLGAFLFARDFAHGRGYRICIDGANIESLPFIDRERLGIDLVKIVWSDLMPGGKMPNGQDIRAYIKKTGMTRIILCRCDSQDAIDCGLEMGITLFQGRHVEALLAAENQKIRNTVGWKS